MGSGKKQPTKEELILAKQCRRSIVALKDLQKDEILTNEMLGIKKPENGIPPKYISTVVGKKVKRNLKQDQALNWKDIA
jgi:sialic acid synthase SpsE